MPNAQSKPIRFYSVFNPPPVTKCDASNKPVDIYDWMINEKTHQPEPVKVGQRDPQADIQAAKGETLTEIMARMPGKNHLEQLNNAVSSGLIGAAPIDGKVIDIRAMQPDFVQNMAVVEKGAAAYTEHPEIAKAPGSNYTEKAINYFQAKIAALEEANKQPAKEGDQK